MTEDKVYLIRFNDSKYREEGVHSVYRNKPDADEKVEKLHNEDEWNYHYYVVEMELR